VLPSCNQEVRFFKFGSCPCHVLQGCLLGIKYDKKWGTVCDEGFNDNSAKVVCKSLGFEEGGVAANRVAVGMGIYI